MQLRGEKREGKGRRGEERGRKGRNCREASIMRMGTTYQIPQADGTIKEFVLAHLPPEQAQRPGFMSVIEKNLIHE